MKSRSMLDEALQYSKAGLYVFPLFYVLKDGNCSCRSRTPCKRIGKHPISRHGVQDATRDEAKIRQWWSETPYANIGIATGHDGLVVMDIDDSGDKTGSDSLNELLAQYGPLPATRTLRTGSGGLHYYFYTSASIPNSANRVGKNIDIRGMGGYVIAPPSNHASGNHYEWISDPNAPIETMPAWLVDRASPASSRIEIKPEDTLQPEVIRDGQQYQLNPQQIIRLLDFIPPDADRDTWWKVGAVLKKELGEEKGFEAWNDWSRKAPDKYDAKVMPVQWNSFTEKGITAGTLFHFAKENGFRGFDVEEADSEDFRNNWCYVAAIKRFVQIDRFTEWDPEQFDSMHQHRFSKGSPSKNVLKNENFRKLEGATYWPNRERFLVEDGVTKINYWQKNELEPINGDVSPFLDHLEYFFPEGPEANILLQYLAFQVQHPGEKVNWAVILEGAQGTGKSYFAKLMRLMLGETNVRLVSNEELHEPYTGWQRNTQLVIVEEMMARQRLELMNKLKPMITERWCKIREMYRPPYLQPNRFNFLFFTNHNDAVIIDKHDRRYCILQTRAVPREASYYKWLFDWTEKNAGELLWYLTREVDLSTFQPHAHAPVTDAKRELILDSMMADDSFIHERVEAKEYPFAWDLHSLPLLVEVMGKYNLRVTPKSLANSFKRLGYLNLGRSGVEDGPRTRLWAVRNAELYSSMSPSQLLAIWNAQLQAGETGLVSEEVVAELGKRMAGGNPMKKNEPM